MAQLLSNRRKDRHDRTGATGRISAKAVRRFFGDRLDMLVDRSILIARENGYTPFTTTIRAAWIEAVQSITTSLGDYLEDPSDTGSGPQACVDYTSDPRFSRMRALARQHRAVGITMAMYVGLFKHFRNIYLDELAAFEPPADGPDHTDLQQHVQDFFDETELSICSDWYTADDSLRLREMQNRTRRIALDKDRYFAVFESLRNPAFLLDKTGALLGANEAATEMFHRDAPASGATHLLSTRRRKAVLGHVMSEILGATPDCQSSVWLDTLQGRRCFDVLRRALHDAVENTPIGHVVMLNDVTAYREATEKAQSAERAMSRFLATMSHEIRTPLHSVLGATELLRTAEPATVSDYLDQIEAAGQSLFLTLNNVLDYSKYTNTPPQPAPARVDLRHALTSFGRLTRMRQKPISPPLGLEISDDVPHEPSIDWTMIQQVLSNLVTNALSADDGRGVSVHVDFIAGQNPGKLRFEIRDHGPGLRDADAEALYYPFENILARDTGNGGTGLGLAIVRYLTRAMNGQVGYDKSECGTVFWFEIPCPEKSQDMARVSHDVAAPRAASPGALRRCLLVDDDPIGGKITAQQLRHLGMEVHRSTSVADALAVTQQRDFDLYVIDFILGDGDGPSLVRHLRDRQSDAQHFVALTANVEVLKSDDLLSHLFDTILAKPVDLARLSAMLGSASLADRQTGGESEPAGLQGLSDDTISGMLIAFEEEWARFRALLNSPDDPANLGDLGYLAHRLAGTTAILGLSELEEPLHTLELLCNGDPDAQDMAALRDRLDRDLNGMASWKQLMKRNCG